MQSPQKRTWEMLMVERDYCLSQTTPIQEPRSGVRRTFGRFPSVRSSQAAQVILKAMGHGLLRWIWGSPPRLRAGPTLSYSPEDQEPARIAVYAANVPRSIRAGIGPVLAMGAGSWRSCVYPGVDRDRSRAGVHLVTAPLRPAGTCDTDRQDVHSPADGIVEKWRSD
jgi:hypothetical protein